MARLDLVAADGQTPRTTARRHAEILALAREAGRVTVEDLAARFAVTLQTIRRDLNELCDRRALTHVHGGAIIAHGVTNLGYEARKLVAQPDKRLIGEAAARLIADHSSLFVNLGTTTEEVARALGGHQGLLVVTNNLHVALELYRHPTTEVVLAGGTVRRSDGGVIGAHKVQVSRAIIQSARRVLLVADSSKFARSAPVRLAHLADIDVLVTDRLPSADIAALCREHAVQVIETGGPVEADAG
jgi:DeoR family glycerol-3-phosphate regulon repressor